MTVQFKATAAMVAICLSASACNAATDRATATTTAPSAPVESLGSLIPTPTGTHQTRGPDAIADNGIHLHYQVDGAPSDVMTAYKSALENTGWSVTTIITSGGGGGGGATYTGTHGDAYGVFDGGGYEKNTYLDVCTWAAKPADPNCTRGER